MVRCWYSGKCTFFRGRLILPKKIHKIIVINYFCRCERCDNYETLNKAAFCAHQDQCLVTGDGGESTEVNEGVENDIDGEGHSGHRSHRKMFECDVCNMKFSNGANMRRHKVFNMCVIKKNIYNL